MHLYLNTLSRVDVLVIGAIGAYFYSGGKLDFSLNRFVRSSLFLILLLSLSLENVFEWNTVFSAVFKKYFYLSLIAVLLIDYNLNTSFKHRLPLNSIVHYFGKISYGIYMYSNIVLLLCLKKIILNNGIENLFCFYLIIFGMTILISIISYELFEKHFLKFSSRFRVIANR
jgi:peptidoglycan/LPS O-acetylase OafA/YrhL